jgi:hypothetical protein
MDLGQLSDAEQSLKRALAIEESGDGQNNRKVAMVLDSLSDLYKKQNRVEASVQAAERAKQIRRASQ